MVETALRVPPEALARAFGFLDEEACASLLPYCRLHKVDKGSNLFSAGDAGDALYMVAKGLLAVKKKTDLGRNFQVIALLYPGAPVGEAALVCAAVRSATVYCVEDAELIRLDIEAFAELRSRYPELALALLAHLLSRVSLRLDKCSARLAHIL